MEVDSDHEHCTFYEKYLATDVAADALGEDWRGYVVWICDEKDTQGFPMKQGILTFARVHLLLSKGCSQGELGKESTYLFRDTLYVVVGYFDHTPGADSNVYLELEGRASC